MLENVEEERLHKALSRSQSSRSQALFLLPALSMNVIRFGYTVNSYGYIVHCSKQRQQLE
jgi:hypothetical protein